MYCFSRESISTLPTLKENCLNNYEKFASPLRDDFDEPEIEHIFKVKFIHTMTKIAFLLKSIVGLTGAL